MSELHALLDKINYMNSKIEEEIANAKTDYDEKMSIFDSMLDELENWFENCNLPVIIFIKGMYKDNVPKLSESEIKETFRSLNELEKDIVFKILEISFKLGDLEISKNKDDFHENDNIYWYNIFKNMI